MSTQLRKVHPSLVFRCACPHCCTFSLLLISSIPPPQYFLRLVFFLLINRRESSCPDIIKSTNGSHRLVTTFPTSLGKKLKAKCSVLFQCVCVFLANNCLSMCQNSCQVRIFLRPGKQVAFKTPIRPLGNLYPFLPVRDRANVLSTCITPPHSLFSLSCGLRLEH